ncbi:sorting nexin-29-like [Plakobranchus ocellatus]|uniref:Sorting nexin-29-like n=1 Tax=Plakobranchus ocellatus TaxID=259542 RepID=A0AAV4DC91_9GAST|nr:sorting nexin-29-like [Plakobranchus ocellatus]
MNGEEVHQNERQAILSRLLDAVKQCQVRFGGRSELATDSDSRVSCLCAAWESALHHGLRKSNKAFTALKQMTEKAGLGKVTDLFSDIKKIEAEPVFWNYVKEHLTKHECQRFTKLKLVTTDCGRGRAWLRASLNEHSLERYMHMLIESDEMLAQHYEDWAFLRDGERNNMLPNMAAGLGSILFAITVDRPELNKGLTALHSIHVQNSVDTAETVDEEEELKPVISSNVSPASAKKREKKKKKKLANVVSFDDADTVGTVITRTGSSSSGGPAIPDFITAALSKAEGPRESGEGAQDDNVFSCDTSDKTSANPGVVTLHNSDRLPAEKATSLLGGAEKEQLVNPVRTSLQESSSSLRSSTSDHMSKSSLCSSTDLDQDSSALMAPVGVDGLVLDTDLVALNSGETSLVRREHSLSIDSEFTREGEIESASLGLKLAQQSVFHSDGWTKISGSSNPLTDSSSHEDMKQAVVQMMLRKESIEEQNKKLEGMLQREMDISSTLRAELEEIRIQHSAQHEKDTSQILALQKENELLKHQLKKYVSAVQMLRTEGSNKDETLGIHLEEPQPSIPPAKQMIDYSYEASEYEKKLIQVAEMHGELMEFNEMLHRQIKDKDALLRQLRDELIQLRGPLPHDRRLSMVPVEDFDGPSLQRTLINIWIPSAFLRGSANNTHHVYQVFVRIKDEEWNVYRRYSQFFDMHARLKKVYPLIGKFEFPPKKAIGKKEAKLVESRRQIFQTYLRNVINVLLEKNESLVNSATKEKLISYLPFFNDKADDDKKGRKNTKRNSSTPAVPEGAVGGDPEVGSPRQPYQGL